MSLTGFILATLCQIGLWLLVCRDQPVTREQFQHAVETHQRNRIG